LGGILQQLQRHGRGSGRNSHWLALEANGDNVKLLQQRLGLPVDGFFGPQTDQRVKEFQAANSLPVDGVVGPRTWAKLFPQPEEQVSAEEEKKESVITPPAAPATKAANKKSWLRSGASGDEVKNLQRALGIPVDGFFGAQTERAVREFQVAHALPVDGLVGPHTWNKLLDAPCNLVPIDAAMEVLVNMGFQDVETNTQLLRKYKGDVDQVVAEILAN
jgi:peptidoglycan hydrolase-like protein with peptidoglycan-binding domain